MSLKRTRHLALTTLMAAAGLNLTACGAQPPQAVTWDAPTGQSTADEPVEALAYKDPLACKVADQASDAECEQAWRTAQADHEANGPRYGDKAACEAEYGEGRCETRTSGGGTFFMPFLAGMMLGRLGGGYRGTGYYQNRGGRLSTPFGGGVFRNPRTGGLVATRAAVERPSAFGRGGTTAGRGSRAVSRGGFGGGYSGRGYGG